MSTQPTDPFGINDPKRNPERMTAAQIGVPMFTTLTEEERVQRVPCSAEDYTRQCELLSGGTNEWVATNYCDCCCKNWTLRRPTTPEERAAYAEDVIDAQATKIGTLQSILAAERARNAVALALIMDAHRIVTGFAKHNPIHEYQGQKQDPWGAHSWITRADALLANAEPVSLWRDMATAPKDGTRILAIIDDDYHVIVRWYGDKWREHYGTEIYPTHWQPLPLPPTREAKR